MKEILKHHFDAAHRLVTYNGKCNNIHGHRWEVEVTVIGEIHKVTGMIIDFKEIKNLIDKFDHKILLRLQGNEKIIECLKDEGLDMIITKEDPTAEYLAQEILFKISSRYYSSLTYIKVILWESPTTSVEVDLDLKN